jgi:copper chaperone NosL
MLNFKKIIPPLIILLIISIVVIVFLSMAKEERPIVMIKGNVEKEALPLKVNFTNDPYCKMLITEQRNSTQVVSPDGNTWFFDDPACMVLWLEEQPFKEEATLWIYTIDTKEWIDARKAWYGRADQTAMHYGFGGRAEQTNGTIDYETMALYVLRGEHLGNPKIRKMLLGK